MPGSACPRICQFRASGTLDDAGNESGETFMNLAPSSIDRAVMDLGVERAQPSPRAKGTFWPPRAYMLSREGHTGGSIGFCLHTPGQVGDDGQDRGPGSRIGP